MAVSEAGPLASAAARAVAVSEAGPVASMAGRAVAVSEAARAVARGCSVVPLVDSAASQAGWMAVGLVPSRSSPLRFVSHLTSRISGPPSGRFAAQHRVVSQCAVYVEHSSCRRPARYAGTAPLTSIRSRSRRAMPRRAHADRGPATVVPGGTARRQWVHASGGRSRRHATPGPDRSGDPPHATRLPPSEAG